IAELVVLSIYLKVKNKSFKYWFLFLGLIAAINTPWELFRRWHDLGIMNESSLLGFYPEILPNYLTGFFATNSWNVWWYIVAIVFFINLPKIIRTDLKYLWLLLFTPVLFFMIIYLFTDAHIAVLDFTAVVRNILTLIPISVLVVGVTLGELWSNTRP
ncbi:MAG: hypothetical protein NT091_04925, partial [Candidatus Falkowbacteria bacterium]|nr:hypothetical protein [Candidatus Falkowbacteria bacterium]